MKRSSTDQLRFYKSEEDNINHIYSQLSIFMEKYLFSLNRNMLTKTNKVEIENAPWQLSPSLYTEKNIKIRNCKIPP